MFSFVHLITKAKMKYTTLDQNIKFIKHLIIV